MHEHLKFERGVLSDFLYFGKTQFPRQDRAAETELFKSVEAVGRHDTHLCRGVERHIRRHFLYKSRDAEVLNNQSVHADGADAL